MMRRVLLAIVCVGLPGCGPRLSALVEHKHYREAICAADDGGQRARGLVARGLVADTETYVHVHRIAAGELARLVGPQLADEALTRVNLVKIVVRTNTLPVDELTLDVTVQGEDMSAAAAPVSWEALAVATGEQVPAPEQVRNYATIGNLLRGIGVVATAGLSLRYTNFQPRTWLMAAPLAVYERDMPKAAALLAALPPVRCEGVGLHAGGTVGQRCTGFFVFDRSSTTQWTLTLAQAYVATREVAGGDVCRYERTTSVAIGDSERWAGLFGPRMRRLEELPGPPATLRWERRVGTR